MISRRDFLTHTAVAGAGLFVGLRAFAGSPFLLTAESLASGSHITPILLVDDAVRLTLLDSSISDDFKSAVIEHQAFALAAGALKQKESEVVTLLSRIRDDWSSRDGMRIKNHTNVGDMLEPKLAFSAGWLAHQAAHQTIYGNNSPDGVSDLALYHDVTLLHAIRESEPVSIGPASGSVDELTNLLSMMYLRAYMRMHTIDPDFDDVQGWILRVVSAQREVEALARRYAEAYLQPDPAKHKAYVVDQNFYNGTDPLIDLARTLQQGVTESTIDLQDAVAQSAAGSKYAQALGRAYLALTSVDAYKDRRIAEVDLRERLNGSY